MPLSPTKLKHWELLKKTDVSPSKWFPIENREYKLPSGRVVKDFTVTTLADVSMIIPVTKNGTIIMVRQFKPGYGDVVLEFPAGRLESGNTDTNKLAIHELEEETGIKTDGLILYGKLSGFTTKATEKIFCYLAKDVEFNSTQQLDDNEEIEIVELTPEEVDVLINSNELKAGISIAAWILAKQKFPEIGA